MIISKELLAHIKDQLQNLYSGMITIELAETSKKLDVVTREVKIGSINIGFNRDISDDFMKTIQEEIESINYGKLFLQVESGEEIVIVKELRKRFKNKSIDRIVPTNSFRNG